jgi:hypothetical protein
MYSDSISQPRRQSARYVEYPPRKGADVAHGPRVEVYENDSSLPRRYPDSDRERRDARIVSRRPARTRDSSPEDDYEHTPQRKSLVLRPRSASRVRLQEPEYVAYESSSDDDRRRRRKSRGDDTHIRATSRPGKKNDYAFVRTPSKGRRKSDAKPVVVRDLELKNDRRHKDFRGRREDLQNTEAAALIRARSRDRERLVDDDSDLESYDGKRRRSNYHGETRRRHGSLDDGRRAIITAGGDRDRDDRRRSTRDPKLYSYGNGLVIADDATELRSERRDPRRRRVSVSPDRGTVDSGSVRLASPLTKLRRSHAWDDRVSDPDVRRDPRRDSAYYTDGERRARDREREAIDREKRAIDREKAALDREKLLVDREGKVPLRDIPDDRRRSAGDYLKQGDQYVKDGQKYYKGGQGVLGGVKSLFK